MARRKIGQSKPAEPAPASPPPEVSIYVAFYYEAKDGETGMHNVVLSGIDNLLSLELIHAAIIEIKKLKQDLDYYTNITLLNWWRVTGTLAGPAPSQPIEPTEIIPPGAQ